MAVPTSGQLTLEGLAQECYYGTYGSGTITDPIYISDLINGITGYKGGVHLHICKPVLNEISTFDELVVKINDSIQGNYKLWPSNYLAVNELSKIDKSYEPYIKANLDAYKSSQFMNRFNGFEDENLQETLRSYARPVINKKKAN